MSNVLIGIIGVILFIGLALAGALFLGPRFQESQNASRASAAVQVSQQIANAAQLRQVDSGERGTAGRASVLSAAGYLKSAPANPVENGWETGTVDENGQLDGPAVYSVVAMYDWPADAGMNAQRSAICAAVAKQYGQTLQANGGPPLAAKPSSASTGCIKLNQAWGEHTAGLYVIWTRI